MKYAAIITIIYTVGGVVLFALSKAAANGDAFLGLEKVVPRSSPRTGSDGLSDRADRERKGPQSYSTTAEHMPECKTPSLERLSKSILDYTHQHSILIMTPDKTVWFTKRK